MVGHINTLLPEVSSLSRRRIEAVPYREMKLSQQLDSTQGVGKSLAYDF
jgi:hypothetical protein